MTSAAEVQMYTVAFAPFALMAIPLVLLGISALAMSVVDFIDARRA